MYRTRCVFLIFSLVVLATCAPSAALAEDRVMVIGDSWAADYADNLESQFAVYGHGTWNVRNRAVPASTARAWADDVGNVLSLIIAELNLTPSIQYVVVSLGGNDLHGGFPFSQIEQDLRTVVGRLSTETYWLQGIVLPGYDILDWDRSNECLLLAAALFGSVLPGVINPLYMEVGARQGIVAGEFSEATYLSLWGTGQGNPGSPNVNAFSPAGYVAEDCIHLTQGGYNQFTREIYCGYFAPNVFGESCDPAPGWGAATGSTADAGLHRGSSGVNGIVFLVLIPLAAAVLFRNRLKRRM